MPVAILITTLERDEKTGRERLVASHGVDIETGREFAVSQDDPRSLGARFDADYAEWVLDAPSGACP